MSKSRGEPANPPPGGPRWDVYHQRIQVAFDYPVYFVRDVFAADNPLLGQVLDRLNEGRRHRAGVFVDAGLARAHPDLIDRIKEYFHARPDRLELTVPPMLTPGGEAAKTSWQGVRDVMWTLGSAHLDRQSYVIALGGGAMLDMVGFAAGIVHRGLRLVRVPTTTLAQADAGVGVKNGMDEHGQKNFAGTFAPPFAVLNDSTFLPTLSDRDWRGGLAEAFKVAIIRDADLLDFLCGRAGDLRGRDLDAMEEVIRRTAWLHLEHLRTSGDAFEFGSARPLDFGHWSAHWIETASGYTVGHGQAVAIGIALDCYYAMRLGLLGREDLEHILGALARAGLPIWCEHLETRVADGTLAVLEGLDRFREHLGGALCVTLPDGLGRKCEVNQINPLLVEETTDFLRARGAQRHADSTRSGHPPDLLPERPPR